MSPVWVTLVQKRAELAVATHGLACSLSTLAHLLRVPEIAVIVAPGRPKLADPEEVHPGEEPDPATDD